MPHQTQFRLRNARKINVFQQARQTITTAQGHHQIRTFGFEFVARIDKSSQGIDFIQALFVRSSKPLHLTQRARLAGHAPTLANKIVYASRNGITILRITRWRDQLQYGHDGLLLYWAVGIILRHLPFNSLTIQIFFVIAFVVHNLTIAFDLNDARGDVVNELTIVRDEEYRSGIFFQSQLK